MYHRVFIYLLSYEHLNCFQFILFFFWTILLLLGFRICECWVLQDIQSCDSKWFHRFPFHQQYVSVPNGLHPCQHLAFSCFVIFAILMGIQCYSMVLITFPWKLMRWKTFSCAYRRKSSVKYLFIFLAHSFLLGCLFSLVGL